MSVRTSRLPSNPTAAVPLHLPAGDRCAALRPKPQNLDLQGGRLLNLGLVLFPPWSSVPLERSGHLKPYLHPEDHGQHLPFAVGLKCRTEG